MCKVQMLRSLVKQRLTAAAEEIFGLFERTIAEYEEELSRSKEENERQRKLLDAVLNPQLRLHRADVQQLLVSKEEEWRSSLDQEDPEPSHIKEEQEELWTSQEGEQLQGLEEADITKFTFSPVPVKSEEDEEEAQSSQLHQRLTEQMETEADGEDCGGPEPARNSDPDRHPQPPDTDDKTGDSSEPEFEDHDEDWKETREPQSTLKNNNVLVSDEIICNTLQKPFSCSECGQRFPSKTQLNEHMLIHIGGKPFSCTVCGRRFNLKANSSCHIVHHTGEKPYSCSVCKKKIKNGGDVGRPLKLHTREKPSTSCVSDTKTANAHSEIHSVPDRRLKPEADDEIGLSSEPEREDREDDWKETGEPPTRLNSLNNNDLPVCDETPEKPASCSFCGKRFTRKYSLKVHMRLHTGEKPFSCSVCGKRFVQRYHYLEHTRCHTGENTFDCSLCGKKFGHNFRLQNHMRTHTGERPVSCSLCSKGFRYNGELIQHMRVHSGEKPFSCSICHRAFRLKYILRNHMKVHSGEEPRSCSG